MHCGKVALYIQQTYVGVGLGLVGLGLGLGVEVGLGRWLTDMLCNCWVYENSWPWIAWKGTDVKKRSEKNKS